MRSRKTALWLRRLLTIDNHRCPVSHQNGWMSAKSIEEGNTLSRFTVQGSWGGRPGRFFQHPWYAQWHHSEMTMDSLHRQLDRLLDLNDYPVFCGGKDYLKEAAERHVRQDMIL